MVSANPLSGFRVETQQVDDCFLVQCHGRLVGQNAPLLRQEVLALVPQRKRIVLDLQEVPMLDSAALGTIVGLYVSARTRGCQLQLINANDQVRNIFRITNLVSLFGVVGRHGRSL